MTFESFNQWSVWTSTQSMWQDNLIKIPFGLEEKGKQSVMENSIESTVKFTKNDIDVKKTL